jgi:hypothetical protein
MANIPTSTPAPAANAAPVLKKARVLLRIIVNGVIYEPNQLLEAEESVIRSLTGQVDAHPDAVAYCEANK